MKEAHRSLAMVVALVMLWMEEEESITDIPATVVFFPALLQATGY